MEAVEKDEAAEPRKRQVHRSPGYPGLSLPEAIERARTIYAKEKRGFTTAAVLAEDLELKALTGPANRVVSALRQYGLLDENDQGRLGISDLAFSLLHLSSISPNREELVKRAALNPTVIAEVFQRLPTGSDAAIRDFLLEEKKFNPAVVDFFVAMYRKTIKFANLAPSSHNPATDDSFPNTEAFSTEIQQEKKVEEHTTPTSTIAQAIPADIPYFRFTLKGATVEFRASGPLSKEHFNLIRAHLKAYEPNQSADE